MILYIIRHGETAWNRVKRMQGQTDIELAQTGVDLAVQTGIGMRDIAIDLVISSPLKRAVQTAKCVTQGRDIPIILDKRIQEISFGEWEGESIFESEKIPEDFRRLFYENPMHCIVPPGGESFQDVCERTKDFYQSLLENEEYKDKSILISTHGGAGRCLLSNFYKDKEDIWRGSIPKNCSVCKVEIGEAHAKVMEMDHIYYVAE